MYLRMSRNIRLFYCFFVCFKWTELGITIQYLNNLTFDWILERTIQKQFYLMYLMTFNLAVWYSTTYKFSSESKLIPTGFSRYPRPIRHNS